MSHFTVILKLASKFFEFISKLMDNWRIAQAKQAGKDSKELEIRDAEDRVVDTLNRIDTSGVSDDEVFKPTNKSN